MTNSCIKTGAFIWLQEFSAAMPADIYDLDPYVLLKFPKSYQDSNFVDKANLPGRISHVLESSPGYQHSFHDEIDGKVIITHKANLAKVPLV